MNNEEAFIWNGRCLNLKNVTAAREYLKHFKDMSVVIRLDNQEDYDILTKAKFKMHGMQNVKIIDGIKHPREYHFDYKKGVKQ